MKTQANIPTVRQENETLVTGFQVDYRFSFPLKTSEVLSVVSAVGYDCPRKALERIFEADAIAKPAKTSGGRYRWTMENVLNLCDFLESRRKWLPGIQRHAKKLTAEEKAKQTRDMTNMFREMQTWATLQPTELLRQMVNEDNRQHRLAMASIILVKMGARPLPTEAEHESA